MKPKLITARLIRSKGACKEQFDLFLKIFPAGMPVTLSACRKAMSAGLDLDWAATNLLSDWKVYDEAMVAAWKVYDKTMTAAWKVYDKARASGKVHGKARTAAWKVYNKARAAVWKVQNEATVAAFWQGWKSQG